MRPSDVGWVDYLGWLFISPRGRIPRSTYWAAKIGLALIFFVVVAISAAASRSEDSGWALLAFILYMFAMISVAIKRLHDRDMSGAWILACFVPYLGELFSLIVLGCLKGDEGANEYGPDPLEPEKAPT